MSEPAKYRKRPVVIDAVQWNGTASGATPIIDWILEGGGTARYACTDDPCTEKDHVIAIDTLEGVMHAGPGWWIIRGLAGEHYPCEDAIFCKSYEPVNEPDTRRDAGGSSPTANRPASPRDSGW